MPRESMFFRMTYEEDYVPIGWAYEDFIIESITMEKQAHESALSDEEVILILCHG